jgi:hypothetical protein
LALSRRSSSASCIPSGTGQVMPTTPARRRYSASVDRLTPTDTAIWRSLSPSACLSLQDFANLPHRRSLGGHRASPCIGAKGGRVRDSFAASESVGPSPSGGGRIGSDYAGRGESGHPTGGRGCALSPEGGHGDRGDELWPEDEARGCCGGRLCGKIPICGRGFRGMLPNWKDTSSRQDLIGR